MFRLSSVAYSVTSEESVARIENGNKLYVTKAGAFTVTAALVDEPALPDVKECYANELVFSNVRILSKIENVTVYTQPIALKGTLNVDGIDFPEDEHYEVCFEVTEGPAEIFTGNYLRFTGSGLVKLKAYSRFNKNVFVSMDILVTDPDQGLEIDDSRELKQGALENAGGCKGSAATAGLAPSLAAALSIFALIKGKIF